MVGSVATRRCRRDRLVLPRWSAIFSLNVAARASPGQRVDLPAGRWDWVLITLDPPAAGPETVWLHYAGSVVDPELLDGGRVPVTRTASLHALDLPDRPECTVTALTLVGPVPPERFEPVSLASYANSRGVLAGPRFAGRGFNIWDNAFPADELPPAGQGCVVNGVPFLFPLVGDADNIRCRGQRVALPAGARPAWLSVLGAAERRAEDLLRLHYADGSARPQWLRLSDFWPDTPARFGDSLAFRCGRMLYPRHEQPNMAPAIWQQRVPVTVPGELVPVELPDNPAMHVFALTLVTEEVAAVAR